MSLSSYLDPFATWLRAAADESWPLLKVAHGVQIVGSGTTPASSNSEYFTEEGGTPWVLTGDLREGDKTVASKQVSALAVSKYPGLKTYQAGSLVVAMYGATIGRLGLLAEASAVNQACCVLAGARKLAPRFMFYWLQAFKSELVRQGEGGGQPNISQDVIKELRVPAPDLALQTAIANYLDGKTAAIDALIAKKELLIEELKKYQEAVIAEALKPREGWTKAKVKGIVTPLPKSPRQAGEAIDDGPYSFYVSGQQVKACETPDYVNAEAVVLATGGGPAVHRAFGSFSFSTDCWALVAKSEGHTGFLYYLLVNMKEALAELGFRGAGIKHLDKDWLLNSVVAVPAKSEQAAIAASLTKRIAGIRKLVESAETVIADARKLRASLISEAVTGKLKLSD